MNFIINIMVSVLKFAIWDNCSIIANKMHVLHIIWKWLLVFWAERMPRHEQVKSNVILSAPLIFQTSNNKHLMLYLHECIRRCTFWISGCRDYEFILCCIPPKTSHVDKPFSSHNLSLSTLPLRWPKANTFHRDSHDFNFIAV